MSRTILTLMAVLALAAMTATAPLAAQVEETDSGELEQVFNAQEAFETRWRLRWEAISGWGPDECDLSARPQEGLMIRSAEFKPGLNQPYMRILSDARLAEVFVTYHDGITRFHDIVAFGYPLLEATADDLGPSGTTLGDRHWVVKELRDRGVVWKDEEQAARVRRGQELVLWAALNAGNYIYIMEFGFRDDGSISFRLGATGHLLGGEETAHLHDALWRVDVDLGDSDHDAVQIVHHRERKSGAGVAQDQISDFNRGREGGADWEAEHFSVLRILDTRQKNANGRPVSYDLVSPRLGNARHFGTPDECPSVDASTERFSLHDFWVTRFREGELFYQRLPEYVADKESVIDTNVVIWHATPMHHLPRDEDRDVTLTIWTGFELHPRNLFSGSPLFP